MFVEGPQGLPSSAANGAGQALDLIFIDGFIGETVIGIHQDELHRTQPVRIDLAAGVPHARACETDRISDTIDYSKVHTALSALLETHHHRLLEAFAEDIATLLLDQFFASWVRVRVTKPRKFPNVDGVGVQIERSRPAQASGEALHQVAIVPLPHQADSTPR